MDSLLFLIEHLPPNAHILAMTRSEPDWPVALLRARGEVTRSTRVTCVFLEEEIAAFLATVLADHAAQTPGPAHRSEDRRAGQPGSAW